jgi:RNA-directed DNA polymerase
MHTTGSTGATRWRLKEPGASLDFLGYTFRYDRDLKGREQKYLNMFPSEKALKRERDKLHDTTDARQCTEMGLLYL